MAYLSLILLISAALFSGATVLSIVIAIHSGREHRNTIFPVVREVEGLKAKRARIGIIVFLVLSGLSMGGWAATLQNPDNILVAQATFEQPLFQEGSALTLNQYQEVVDISESQTVDIAEQNSTESKNTQEVAMQENENEGQSVDDGTRNLNSDAVSPTSLDLVTSPPQIVGTTIIVTSEPTKEPTKVVVKPQEEAVSPPEVVLVSAEPTPLPPTPSPIPSIASASNEANVSTVHEANLGPIDFAVNITSKHEAIEPAQVFGTNVQKIYAVFPYQKMKNGVPFSAIWYYQNQELFRYEYEWSWGSASRSYVFIEPVGPGNYKVELKVGNDILATDAFEIVP